MPESELSIVVASKENIPKIKWVDQNEFRFEGNLYDVVKAEQNQNGETIYKCINDTQEKKLFSKLDELIHNAFEGKSKNNSKIAKHLVKDYLFNTLLLNGVFPVNGIAYNLVTEVEESCFLASTSPPPQTV